jgi:hypothetical protein
VHAVRISKSVCCQPLGRAATERIGALHREPVAQPSMRSLRQLIKAGVDGKCRAAARLPTASTATAVNEDL